MLVRNIVRTFMSSLPKRRCLAARRLLSRAQKLNEREKRLDETGNGFLKHRFRSIVKVQ